MWWFSRDPQHPDQIASLQEDRRTLIVVAALIVLLSLERLLPAEWRIISAARPPDPFAVLIALAAAFLIVAAIDRLTRKHNRRRVLIGCILFLIALFAVLNTEALATSISRVWRTLTGQAQRTRSSLSGYVTSLEVAAHWVLTLAASCGARLPSPVGK